MPEAWTISPDEKSATVSGRVRMPLSKKLNPVWWFENDAEQNLSGADWFHPTLPQVEREVLWEARNPLQNFRCFVLGVQDRNYTVTGRANVMTVQRNDITPETTGFQWCTLHTAIPLFFISYSGKYAVWYAGWQPSGFFGFKANRWAQLVLAVIAAAAIGRWYIPR